MSRALKAAYLKDIWEVLRVQRADKVRLEGYETIRHFPLSLEVSF